MDISQNGEATVEKRKKTICHRIRTERIFCTWTKIGKNILLTNPTENSNQLTISAHIIEGVNRTQHMRLHPYVFTGKERDEETGFSYFGARYYDSDLSGLFLSVDPLADKYPNISPYAYCAWNPLKLVDPDGREIDVSYLSEAIQARLVKCLSTITGLSLYIEGNKLKYKKDEDGQVIVSSGSQTARTDLIAAIDKKNEDGSNYVIEVGHGAQCEGGQKENKKGGLIYMNCLNLRTEEDAQTNGLGMIFLHELRHAVTGEDDPGESACDYNSFGDPHSLKTGPVVDRVNEYRRELGMPIRIQYVARHDGKVPFLDTKYKITPKNIRNHVIWKNL